MCICCGDRACRVALGRVSAGLGALWSTTHKGFVRVHLCVFNAGVFLLQTVAEICQFGPWGLDVDLHCF